MGLRDRTFELPRGRVAVGVRLNGGGKTTLMHLAVGGLRSAAGVIRVLGFNGVTDRLVPGPDQLPIGVSAPHATACPW